MLEACDKREVTILIQIDLTQAFDRVNHGKLVNALQRYGLSEVACRWFRSYLNGRKQRVRTPQNRLSGWEIKSKGVPQGSTLSSLLFLLYINSIDSVFSDCKFLMYADDLNMYKACKISVLNDSVAKVNAEVERLQAWGSAIDLKINPTKSRAIIVGHPRLISNIDFSCVPPVVVEGCELPYEESISCLGMQIHKGLCWNEQIMLSRKKANSALNQIQRTLIIKSHQVKKQLVTALVLPHLYFGLTVMTDLTGKQYHDLQVTLNSCVRFVCNLDIYARIQNHLTALNMLSIKQHQEYVLAKLTCNILHSGSPKVIFEMLSSIRTMNTRDTRNSKLNLPTPYGATSTYQKSLIPSMIRL